MRTLLLTFITVAAIGLPLAAEEKEAPAKPGPRAKREQAVREYLQKLPADQRKKVVAAVKDVWDDAEVKAAREQLQAAVDNYKKAMREAVGESDPEVRELVRPLVDRLVRDGLSPGSLRDGTEGPPRYLRALGLSVEQFGRLSPEERRILLTARRAVLNHPQVRSAFANLDKKGAAQKQDTPEELTAVARAAAISHDERIKAILEKATAAD